jgi:hypothetical protein
MPMMQDQRNPSQARLIGKCGAGNKLARRRPPTARFQRPTVAGVRACTIAAGTWGYSFNENLCVSAFGRNLTNKAHLVSGLTSSAGFNGTYAAPRELGLALGDRF